MIEDIHPDIDLDDDLGLGLGVTNWRREATLSMSQTAEILRISRNSAYAAAKRGDIPTVRFGGKILVPVARLRALLGELESIEGVNHGESSR